MKYLSILFIVLLIASCAQQYPPLEENTAQLRDPQMAPFYHGVASGEPLPSSVLLWTRVTPETQLPKISVNWEMAEDAEFQKIVAKGKTQTDTLRDYTVKVVVEKLSPGTDYYYRFHALDGTSQTGRTRTATTSADELVFAIVSCSNYEFGYFNGYGAIAEEEGLSAVIHLGDYIYEYGPGTYGDTTIGRVHIPAHEIITLRDYRDRYAQYRLDPDLIAAHARHPFITVWDDHEIANNAYLDGAENHQEDEGSYKDRKAAAVKAYYEWLPVRENGPLYRSFSFGNLADLIMLDERLEGRTQPADSVNDPLMAQEDRSMLGQEQLDWFLSSLQSSEAQWKLIGNQVIYSYLNWGHPSFNINLDSWDGYPLEQEKIAQTIREQEIQNVVFVTGDTHTAWAFEATNDPFERYNPLTGEGAFAVEFGTTSINSGNSNERFPTDQVLAHEQKIVNSPINPHLKYANMRDHGYLMLTLTPDEAIARWKFLQTLRERNRGIASAVTIKVAKNSTRLIVE